MRTATNLSIDHETAAFGEDFAELQRVEKAYRALEAVLEDVAVKVRAKRSTRTICEMGQGIANAWADACFGATLSLAEDAAVEARVVEIQPARIATSHLAEVIKVGAAE